MVGNIKPAYTLKLKRISAGLSGISEKKRHVKCGSKKFPPEQREGSYVIYHKEEGQRKDWGDRKKEFILEHIKYKLCVRHPSGGVELSWI